MRAIIKQTIAGDVDDDAVFPIADVTLHMPIEVADYVDFYASENHASNLGRLFRPQNPDPLMPNWKHLPVGYHGRSSTVVTSGVDIVRPCGQRKGPNDEALCTARRSVSTSKRDGLHRRRGLEDG